MKKDTKNIIAELEELNASKLIQIKNLEEDIPEFYFENLHKQLQEKTIENKKKSIYRLIVPFSVAASILLIFGLFLSTISTKNSIEWEAVNKIELENYIFNNIDDFSENEIASFSDIEELSILFSTSIPEEELNEFLLDSDLEENEHFF